MTDTAETSIRAYKKILAEGDDVSLRRRVAAAIADNPSTLSELDAVLDEHSTNAIRPRVNELIRMGCVERRGKRRNPSGHEAYVNHITERGWAYIRGDIDPDPEPTIAERKTKVVDIAREHVRGAADRDVLRLAVERHDEAKRRADPEWDGGLR